MESVADKGVPSASSGQALRLRRRGAACAQDDSI